MQIETNFFKSMEYIKLRSILKQLSEYRIPADMLLMMIENNSIDWDIIEKIYMTIAKAIRKTNDSELKERLYTANNYINQLRKKELQDKDDEDINDLLLKI